MANRQVCAWCAKEGVLTVIQEGEEPVSHGICAYHSQQVEAEYVRAAFDPAFHADMDSTTLAFDGTVGDGLENS